MLDGAEVYEGGRSQPLAFTLRQTSPVPLIFAFVFAFVCLAKSLRDIGFPSVHALYPLLSRSRRIRCTNKNTI
jgi:hypothetical protein